MCDMEAEGIEILPNGHWIDSGPQPGPTLPTQESHKTPLRDLRPACGLGFKVTRNKSGVIDEIHQHTALKSTMVYN